MHNTHGLNLSRNRVSALLAAGQNGKAFRSRLFDAISVEGPLVLLGVPNSCIADVAEYVHDSRRRADQIMVLYPGSFTNLDMSLAVRAAREGTLFIENFQSLPAANRAILREVGSAGSVILGITLDGGYFISGNQDDLRGLPCVAIPRFRDIRDDAVAIAHAFLDFCGYSFSDDGHSVIDSAVAGFRGIGVGEFFDSIDLSVRLSPDYFPTSVPPHVPVLLDDSDARCGIRVVSSVMRGQLSEIQQKTMEAIYSHKNPFALGLPPASFAPTVAYLSSATGFSEAEIRLNSSFIVSIIRERRKCLLESLAPNHSVSDIARKFDTSPTFISIELKHYGIPVTVRYAKGSSCTPDMNAAMVVESK